MAHSITDVEKFWNENPLFTGEEEFSKERSQQFFEKHDAAYYDDVFAGVNYREQFYLPQSDDKTLDLGCGIGFWSSMFAKNCQVTDLTSGDLSANSLEICKLRVPSTNAVKVNAEKIDFPDETYDFVNCQGVIHHTPDTQSCANEIYRVLKTGGRASVSVYYDNVLLKMASLALPVVNFASGLFLKDKGRGRAFHKATSKEDIVRLYDGADNPIGKSYTRKEFEEMLKTAGFQEIEIGYFFFPFRFLRIKIPNALRTVLVKMFPFMIVANLKK